MKQVAVLVCLGLALAACSTPESTERHRQTCSSYGHAEGSPELAACIESKSNEGESAASKVGTSVLTKVILGAI